MFADTMKKTLRQYKSMTLYVVGTLAVALVCVIVGSFFSGISKRDMNLTLYIGGYGSAITKGTFNTRTGEFTRIAELKMENPSYMTLVKDGRRIYAVSEVDDNSGISGFKDLHQINSRSDIGWGPCYLAYHRGHLFTANYGDGSISVFPIDTSGGIKASSQLIKFVPGRPGTSQPVSRIHTVRVLKGKESQNEYLLATDLGGDRIYFYRIMQDEENSNDQSNLENGARLKLYRCDTAYYDISEGYGPRQVAFSKSGRFMYLLCQTSGKIIAYTIKEADNNLILEKIQEVQSDAYNGMACGDIQIHPNGHFLYASNRKVNDGISIFRIMEDGTLNKFAYQVTASGPRQFTITPDGDFMFVACQQGGVVQIFKIDKRSGMLEKTAKDIVFQNLQPSCVLVSSI